MQPRARDLWSHRIGQLRLTLRQRDERRGEQGLVFQRQRCLRSLSGRDASGFEELLCRLRP